MEIMGLAIIVILVVLGILFAILWMSEPTSKTASKAGTSVLTANFLNTMLGTTTDCKSRTVRDLLEDCALTGGIITCQGISSCSKAQEVIEGLFEKTLQVWNKEYHFEITGAVLVEELSWGTEPCLGGREQKMHPVPVRPGFDIILRLEICD